MATFPTAADMERRAPRVSGGVASYRPVSRPEIGTEAAQALFEQGRMTQALAADVDRLGAELDETVAQDALNQLRTKRQELTLDPEKGFQRIKGGDVLKPGPGGKPWLDELPAQFRASSDEIGGKLFSPRARALYKRAADRELVAYKRDLTLHMTAESEKYQDAVYKDTLGANLNQAVTASDPAQLEMLADKAGVLAARRAERLGLPAETAIAAARSDVLAVAIKSKLQANDPAAATLFRLYADKLDAKDRVALAGPIQTLEVGAYARNFVSPVDEAKGRDFVMQSRIAAKDDPITAAAWAANINHESRFNPGAINPKDGRDGSDSIGVGQWNGARAQALRKFALERGANPNDINTQLAYLQAEVEGIIPPSVSGIDPGFKDRLKNAKTVEEKARLISLQFFKPAGGEGEANSRALTAVKYLNETADQYDPLRKAINAGEPQAATAEGPRGFLDTKKMLIDLELWREAENTRNLTAHANDPARLSAVKQIIDQRYGLEKQRIEIQKMQLDKAVDDWMTTPGPGGGPRTERPPPEIWNQLTYEKQRSIDATLAHNAKGQDVVTDQQVWYEIQRGLSSADPAERARWANVSLWEYKSKLSASDFQEIAKMQGEVRKGDPEKNITHLRSLNQVVDDALINMRIDPTPKPGSTDGEKAALFRRRVQDEVNAFESTKGAKATREEFQKIVDGLTRKVAGTDGWLGLGGYKRTFEMKVDDVPKVERLKIEEALKRNGRPVTDQAIIDLYSRKNAR